LGAIALFAVGPVQRPQVTRDAGVNLLHPPGDLGDGVIFVAVVHCFELTAVDRNNGMSEELEPTAKLDKLPTHRPDRRAVVLAKVGDRLEVGRQPPRSATSARYCAALPARDAGSTAPG